MEDIKVWGRPVHHGDPSVEVSWLRHDAALMVLLGEHDLASSTSLEQRIDDALARASHVVIDVGEAEFIDSSTIYVLVSACRRAERAGVRFNLVVGKDEIVRRALEIAGVLGTLNAVESLGEALGPDPVGNGGSTRTTPNGIRRQGRGGTTDA
jgi:anti-anti-sigma factor